MLKLANNLLAENQINETESNVNFRSRLICGALEC